MKRVLGPGWRSTVSRLGQSSKPQSEGIVRFDYDREDYSRSKISLQEYRHHVALDGCRDGLDVIIADTWCIQHYQ